MEQLYRNYWADQSCLAAGLQVLGVSLSIILFVLLLCAFFSWLVLRRQPQAERGSNARILALVFGGCGVVLAGVAAYIVFLDTVVRRIHVAGDAFVFDTCRGPAARTRHVAAGDLAEIYHRSSLSSGKKREHIDELVFRLTTGEPIIVRLSTDPDALNFALLNRSVPHEVITRWIAARRERGWSIPPELAAIE